MAALHVYSVAFELPDGQIVIFASEARSMREAIQNVERYAPTAVAVRVEYHPTRSRFEIKEPHRYAPQMRKVGA
jgi:hypothetical protein